MLVLTRYPGQRIVIGNDFEDPEKNVEVTILNVRGEQVRLGVKAPKEIAVHRQEIFDRIKSEKQQNSTANGN